MDFYVILLRIIHIFGGIYWVGTAFFLAVVLVPASRRLGANSMTVTGPVYSNPMFGIGFAASAILTTVAGTLLWWEISDGFNADYMGSDQGIVLSIGVLAGFLGFGHGLGALGRYGRKFEQAYTAEPRDVEAATQAENKIARNSYISLGLMIISVVGMSSARYVG